MTCPECDGTGCPCLLWRYFDAGCVCGCPTCGSRAFRYELVQLPRWTVAFVRDPHPQYRWRLAIGPIEIRRWR